MSKSIPSEITPHIFRGSRLTTNRACLPIVLHGNKGLAVAFVDVVNGADVGMIERRGSLSFTLEAFQR
jgi:hypothetical protein